MDASRAVGAATASEESKAKAAMVATLFENIFCDEAKNVCVVVCCLYDGHSIVIVGSSYIALFVQAFMLPTETSLD